MAEREGVSLEGEKRTSPCAYLSIIREVEAEAEAEVEVEANDL